MQEADPIQPFTCGEIGLGAGLFPSGCFHKIYGVLNFYCAIYIQQLPIHSVSPTQSEELLLPDRVDRPRMPFVEGGYMYSVPYRSWQFFYNANQGHIGGFRSRSTPAKCLQTSYRTFVTNHLEYTSAMYTKHVSYYLQFDKTSIVPKYSNRRMTTYQLLDHFLPIWQVIQYPLYYTKPAIDRAERSTNHDMGLWWEKSRYGLGYKGPPVQSKSIQRRISEVHLVINRASFVLTLTGKQTEHFLHHASACQNTPIPATIAPAYIVYHKQCTLYAEIGRSNGYPL